MNVRKTISRFASAAGIVAVAGATLVLTSPAPAFAAACGSSGDGKNPDAVSCAEPCHNTATTIYSRSFPGLGNIELRYSYGCRIAWARGVGGVEIQVRSYRNWNDPWGAARRIEINYDTDNGGFTRTVNDAVPLQAEACIFDTSGNHHCTPRY
jgi:hypothetical protein